MRYGRTHFHYGMIYVLITSIVLLFLNIYCTETSHLLFYQSKYSSMLEKTLLVSAELGEMEVINEDSVISSLSNMDNLTVTRLIVTDSTGKGLYDSLEEENKELYYLYPEIVQALQGYDSFSMQYHDGVIESQCASPIISYGKLVGCVYLMEYDGQQGALIYSLLTNILTVTIILVIVIFIFSICFSTFFSKRLRRIMTSLHIIREGDYSHKVHIGGHDELTVLGKEFNDLTERLQESEDRRRQFVSDASHELKTPLASIKLLTDSILQNEMDTDTIREFVADIGNEADRLNRMSYKLLSLSKADSDLANDCEIVFIYPTIRRVIRMLSSIADQAAVTIRMDLVEDCSILILEDDLYEILFNLVENGIKYNVPGGQLSIRLERKDENAVIQIRDTGVGIPENSKAHIFERFYRVDKARSRQSGGSGLGLAIVHDLVQRNRGQIEVSSVMGKNSGTTFTVTFPVFDVEEDEV